MRDMGEVRYICTSYACYRSLLARGLSIDSRAYVSSLHARWPIRTPEWSSRLSGQSRILFTQSRGTPEHERHHGKSFRMLYFPEFILPPHLSVFGHRAILVWGCLQNKRIRYAFDQQDRFPMTSGRLRVYFWLKH